MFRNETILKILILCKINLLQLNLWAGVRKKPTGVAAQDISYPNVFIDPYNHECCAKIFYN